MRYVIKVGTSTPRAIAMYISRLLERERESERESESERERESARAREREAEGD